MKLTKYEHACFTVERNGQLLVVDPGAYTNDLTELHNVVAIVITHAHPDHFDQNHLTPLFAANPAATLYGPPDVTAQLSAQQAVPVTSGDSITIGSFTLEFFGAVHHTIYPSLPAVQNIGLFINNRLYYPGDSFVVPDRAVDTLALPVAAPWLQLGEAVQFLLDVHPRLSFPTHDAIYSDIGKKLADNLVQTLIKGSGMEYRRIINTLDIPD